MLCNSIGYFNNLTHEMKIANPTAIVLQGKLFCETNKCIN